MQLRPALLLAFVSATLSAQDHWVPTWTTAQLLARTPVPASANAPAAATGYADQTIRMIVRTSIAGRRVRIKLSNAFGSAPVMLGAAHIALRAKDSEIAPGTDRPLSFHGKPDAAIGPGVMLLSDPVDLGIPALADVAVSLYFRGETGPPTTHATGLHNTYISKTGDFTSQAAIPDATVTTAYYWLYGVEVLAPAATALLVTFGDSITDGSRSSNETNHSWPALLAARLAQSKQGSNIAVANMGIGGNRVLRDGNGTSALARFDRDVLSQGGVKWVTVLEGINDIGRGANNPAEAVTADELIAAYQQIIERAHEHGIQVIGCTLTPFEAAPYYREPGETVRSAVNSWIRTGGAFDAVMDFDAATRDPANPKKLKAQYDSGDHLHPNDDGYQAMADAFDIGLFTKKKK